MICHILQINANWVANYIIKGSQLWKILETSKFCQKEAILERILFSFCTKSQRLPNIGVCPWLWKMYKKVSKTIEKSSSRLELTRSIVHFNAPLKKMRSEEVPTTIEIVVWAETRKNVPISGWLAFWFCPPVARAKYCPFLKRYKMYVPTNVQVRVPLEL